MGKCVAICNRIASPRVDSQDDACLRKQRSTLRRWLFLQGAAFSRPTGNANGENHQSRISRTREKGKPLE